MTKRPSLLWVHGDMSPLGGAQRDILVALPAHMKKWEVTLATLNAPREVRDVLEENGARLVTPEVPWIQPSGGLAEVSVSAGRSAVRRWRRMLVEAEGLTLRTALDQADAVMISSGVGSLEILPVIPARLPMHAFLIEMHRGVHDDVLQRGLDGRLKRPMWITRCLLWRLRRWDLLWHRRLWNRASTVISSNTPTSIRRLAEAHGWVALDHWVAGQHEARDEMGRPAGVGILWHCVAGDARPEEAPEQETEAWAEFEHRPQGDYLLTIGRASYMKGSLEALHIARGAGLPLVHVGGGEIEALRKHADEMGAHLLAIPRISGIEITALMRNAVALLGIAHGEGFGLTPLEAMMVGTPALVVDEAGFTHTVTDGRNGRRLAWPVDDASMEAWVEAIVQARDRQNRRAWSSTGRKRVLERWTPEHQAEALARSFATLGVGVATSAEPLLPGLDPA